MNDSDLKAMAARIAIKWQGNKPPERAKSEVRELGPGESSSQEIPKPPAGLRDPKEREE